MFTNIEIKARTTNADAIRSYLLSEGAVFKGTDQQCDTYFQVPAGRLKLRQGNIENNLIWYERPDQPGPKTSSFKLVPVPDSEALKELLTLALGIKVTVMKKREIYYIANVKFHLDELGGLGHFVEIEAGNVHDISIPVQQLREQCDFYLNAFGIRDEDLVYNSYSDMLMGSYR
jgi:adenylate cyclase, class 2